ncbi:DDE-type integrase/transposase/recombinase [Shinella kummerowiae]|uniref:DDE-type integrase/transposase/recombinase n=1 Tax=Shinella kummerowiae TaxID=417745 RepID=UPI0021B5D07D|nr:DDE-type integrase/transposase/recombinase [Shinella kummerowiae]MCT7662256.1 DDE-type integrase/transposase/recombinase [Shinella kummerowiae]
MKVWLTAREIAEEQLPELPKTESAIIRLAKREGWNTHPCYVRVRAAVGGGLEYDYHLLPTLAQVAYVQRHMVVGNEPPDPEAAASHPTSSVLTDVAAKERDARLAVLAAFDRFARGMRLHQRACMQIFCDRYQMGMIKVDDWVKDLVPSVSKRSIARWRSIQSAGAADDLGVDRSRARAGTGLLDTANDGMVRDFVLAWIAAGPHLSADTIRGYCKDRFGDEISDRNGELKPLPPARTFQHFIKALKASQKVVLTKITNPDKYKSAMKLSGTGTLRHIKDPNALWMIDASPVDALCLDGRHSLYACIDIATRRMVITLSKTPRASAVSLMMRKAILKWGVAKVIKTDNGSDFVAVAIKRLFANLDIEPDVSDAYSPEQKAHVERVIKTFQHEVCPQLPGYIGHSVADRKEIEGRKSFAQRLGADEKELFEVSLTAEQLQRHIDDWLEYKYHEREHGGLKGQTPHAVAAASTSEISRVDERALDVLLMPVAGKNGRRTMTKQGLKIDHFYYLTGSIMVGAEVFVRLDPIDMGKVYAFSLEDGRFLDVAICPELSDVNPAEYVRAQKQVQAELLRENERKIKADIRELKKGPSGIERTIRLAKREAAEREAQNANVIPLPKREGQHSTPAIVAALEVHAGPKAAPTKASDAQREIVLADLAPPRAFENVTPIRTEPTPAQRFRTALDIEQRHAAGEPVDAEQLIWFGSYRESAEYKAARAMWEDFGDQAPGLRT